MTADIYSIVLAAGSGSRFGSTKQLATYKGEALVTRACRVAESLTGARTLLVTGADCGSVMAERPLRSGFYVHNDAYACGMSGSIACGIRAISGVADCALLLLADQPLITREHLAALVRRSQSSPASIVATAFAEQLGPPVIFPKALFGKLLALSGDRGARSLIDEHRHLLQEIRFEDAARDVDRPEDLADLP